MEVPGTPIGASFFEFELKPTGKDSADPTQHEFQHHIQGVSKKTSECLFVQYIQNQLTDF